MGIAHDVQTIVCTCIRLGELRSVLSSSKSEACLLAEGLCEALAEAGLVQEKVPTWDGEGAVPAWTTHEYTFVDGTMFVPSYDGGRAYD